MDNPKIPRFSFNLSSPQHKHLGCIMADDEVFHRINKLDEFHNALGYKDGIKAIGMPLDEFVWDRYIRAGAEKSSECLQHLIMGYLHKHCKRFEKEYAAEFEKMAGKCISDKVDDSAPCFDCLMHPRFFYE